MTGTDAARLSRSGRWRALAFALAITAYLNSLGNGFAYDDTSIVETNPTVIAGDVARAVASPYQPQAGPGAGLYRPVTVASFAVEWPLWGGAPLGFHAVNVLLHGAVTVLVMLLLEAFVILPGAAAGAILFAVHPVHTEVVANVVGRAELWAALFFLLACLLYLRGSEWSGARRGLRLVGLGALYFLALGSKEIAVTLPAALLLLEAFRTGPSALGRRVRDEIATYALLGVVLAAYLCTRFLVLGTVTGEVTAPVLQTMGTPRRFLTALSLWPEYLRLLLFPRDLVADYSPAVLFPAPGFDAVVALGIGVLAGLALVAVRSWRGSSPSIALGILWFALTILPVSNLFFSTGILLAERTLYLPSVGLSFAGAGVAALLAARPPEVRRWGLVGGFVVAALLLGRTVLRNPSWMSSYTVLNTLAMEHPESHLALRARAIGLDRAGETAEAARIFDTAVELAPRNYALLTEAAELRGRQGEWARAEDLLRRAIPVAPYRPTAYRLLANHLIRRGRFREAHAVAVEGLARSGPDRELWALLSESWVARGDLGAAIRARRAALGQDPSSGRDWDRLVELLAATGDDAASVAATRERDRILERSGRSGP